MNKFFTAFQKGEQVDHHKFGTGRGLSEFMNVIYQPAMPTKQLLLSRKENKNNIITATELTSLFPESAATEVANATNWLHQAGKERAGGRPVGIHLILVAYKTQVLQLPLITKHNEDHYLNRIIAAGHHDSMEDLPSTLAQLDEYLETGNIQGKYTLPPIVQQTVQHHTNIIKPLTKALTKIIQEEDAYSYYGIDAALENLQASLKNEYLQAGMDKIIAKTDDLWKTINGDIPNQEEKAKAILQELNGRLTRYRLFFELFENTPLADQVIKFADSDENSRDDKYLTKDKTDMRVSRGGKTVIINEHYHKIQPQLMTRGTIDEAYMPIALLHYATIEHALKKFNTKGYINNQYINKKEKKDEYYMIRDRVQQMANDMREELNAFKEDTAVHQYIKAMRVPPQNKKGKINLINAA